MARFIVGSVVAVVGLWWKHNFRAALMLALLGLSASACDLAPARVDARGSSTATAVDTGTSSASQMPPASTSAAARLTPAATPSSTGTERSSASVGGLDLGEVPERERAELESTVALADAGGPFPYAKDGTTFGNREGRLPKRGRGYYREYTVQTPGSRDRGPRRLVCGNKGDCYYTRDHYDSFIAIRRKENE